MSSCRLGHFAFAISSQPLSPMLFSLFNNWNLWDWEIVSCPIVPLQGTHNPTNQYCCMLHLHHRYQRWGLSDVFARLMQDACSPPHWFHLTLQLKYGCTIYFCEYFLLFFLLRWFPRWSVECHLSRCSSCLS